MKRSITKFQLGIFFAIFAFAIAAHGQTVPHVTGTFKTPGNQTPTQAGLRSIATIGATPVYGSIDFAPYDAAGNRATRILCGGITYIPQPVRAWVKGDGTLVDNATAAAGVDLIPEVGCNPTGLVMRAVITFAPSPDGRIRSVTWTEDKQLPQQSSVDWGSLSIATIVTPAFSYQLQSQGAVTDFENWTGIAAPANPSSGQARVFFNSSTQKLACLTSSGADCNPAGSGGGATLQTNGVNNTSQSTLNQQDSGTISFSNPSAGNVQAAIKNSSVTNAMLSGLVGLAHGGVNLDLTGTGGAGQYFKQSSLGGAVTIGTIPYSDLTGTPTLFNQQLQANTTNQNQRANLNFSTNFSLSDNAGANRSTVDLAGTISANTSGNAATATALAADGSNCSANQFNKGVDASGNAQSCAALVAADIPNLDASKITTGLLALARGGTNADLSATGGAGQYLKQSSSGAAITVGTIPYSDLTGTPSLFYQTLQSGGAAQTQRPAFNFIQGANVTLTVADNPGSSRTDITIAATGGSGSGCIPPGTLGNLLYDNTGGACLDFAQLTVSGNALTAGSLLDADYSPGHTFKFKVGAGSTLTANGTNGQPLLANGDGTFTPGDPVVSQANWRLLNANIGGWAGQQLGPMAVYGRNPGLVLVPGVNAYITNISPGVRIGITDAFGNPLSSDSTGYGPSNAINALDSNLLGTLGTAFSTPGKVDIKGADGDVFVRQLTAANLNATVVGTGTFAVQAAQSGAWTVQPGNTANTTPWLVSLSGTNSNVGVTQQTSPWVDNVTQFGGTNISTGTGAGGAGIPRVTVSNDSNILATQSGTWTVQPGNTANTTPWLFQIRDAAGNARGANVNASNQLSVSVDNNPVLGAGSAVIGHVIADSGSTTAVTQGTFANLKGQSELFDSAGNGLTSNSTTYTAKFGIDSNLLGTLGTAFSTPGFIDVKGADGNIFVRQSNAANLNATVVFASAQHTICDSGCSAASITGTFNTPPNWAIPNAPLSLANGGTASFQLDAFGRLITIGAYEQQILAALQTSAVRGAAPILGTFNRPIRSTGDALDVNVKYPAASADPCNGQKADIAFSQTANSVVVSGSSGYTHVCFKKMISPDAETYSWVGGTGTTCGTGTYALDGATTAANGPSYAAQGGDVEEGAGVTIMVTKNPGDDVCLLQSGSGRVAGHVMVARSFSW